MNKLLLICSSALVLGLFTTGCQSQKPRATNFAEPAVSFAKVGETNLIAPTLLLPATNLFTLGPGDQLEIEILGRPASRALAVVGPDGKIYFHLLPGLEVWGLTLAQTRELIERGLAQYLSDPRVSVVLREVGSRHVWVLGR